MRRIVDRTPPVVSRLPLRCWQRLRLPGQVRRDALLQAGGFDTRFSFYGEDTDIARRMSRVGRVKFCWALTARSSGRRLRGDGLLMTGVRYSLNYLWTTFLRRPFTEAWNDYR